jgi:integrase
MARDLRKSLEQACDSKLGPWAPVALTGTGKPWGEYGLNQAFRRVQRRVKRSGWTFHSLRHFFVTELFRRGANAAAIQRLAGHADLATTQLYADVDASDLRAAIQRMDRESEATGEGGEQTPS